MNKLLISIIALFLAAGGVYFVLQGRIKSPGDKTFTENIGNASKLYDLIIVDSPRPNQTVKSPLTITGQARGSWFFEASFPIVIVDANNNELGRGVAQAQGDWMTENFVPFGAVLEFDTPQTSAGFLILKKDNPSGLPENDRQLIVPVKF